MEKGERGTRKRTTYMWSANTETGAVKTGVMLTADVNLLLVSMTPVAK
jgi:hypothetical protein